jgi:long-chain fatty acid transport protein
MKRNLNFAMVAAILVQLANTLTNASDLSQADGITQNHSAEYVRTLNRNASCDADAAFYNPAGLAFFDSKGLFFMFSNQTFYFYREHTMDYYEIYAEGVSPNPVETAHNTSKDFKSDLPEKYTTETTAPLLPDISVVWKGNDLSAFFSFNILQVAPAITYANGLASVDYGLLSSAETMMLNGGGKHFISLYRNEKLIRDEMYIGATAGFAHTVGDILSLAFALRYINASGKMQIHVTNVMYNADYGSGETIIPPEPTMDKDWNLETDTKGQGLGFIGGMHFKPLKGMDIGLRYEYYTPLVLKKKTVHFSAPLLVENSGELDIFKDGSKSPDGMEYTSADSNGQSNLKVTYPQTLSGGLSFWLLKNLRAEVSAGIVFRPMLDLDGIENNYTLGSSAGGCLEWSIWKNFKLSSGYVYNNTGVKPAARNEADPLLNSHSLGGGCDLKVNDRLNISVGFYRMFFVKTTQFTSKFTDISGPTTHYMKKTYDETKFSTAIGFTYRLR